MAVSVADNHRSRGPVLVVVGGFLCLAFLACAAYRGGSIDWIVFTPVAALMAVVAMVGATGLRYVVGPHAILVRVLGVTLSRIAIDQISAIDVRKVAPIRDYGGWGIRGTHADRAFLIGSGRGVRLRLPDRSVFLGSEDPQALSESIAAT